MSSPKYLMYIWRDWSKIRLKSDSPLRTKEITRTADPESAPEALTNMWSFIMLYIISNKLWLLCSAMGCFDAKTRGKEVKDTHTLLLPFLLSAFPHPCLSDRTLQRGDVDWDMSGEVRLCKDWHDIPFYPLTCWPFEVSWNHIWCHFTTELYKEMKFVVPFMLPTKIKGHIEKWYNYIQK